MKTGERVLKALYSKYSVGDHDGEVLTKSQESEIIKIIERESGCNELAAVLEGGEEL